MAADSLIKPDWSAPDTIAAVSTTRLGGSSQAPYNSLNLGTHVGDKACCVVRNRDYLSRQAALPDAPLWLEQVHGNKAIDSRDWHHNIKADAIYSNQPEQVCGILTADCLPVLLTDRQGQQVAAVHAGWRGLLNGVIENTVSLFDGDRKNILAWLGPAIGPTQFEVGSEVYAAFSANSARAKEAFIAVDASHYLADIYLLATQRIQALGIDAISGGHFCTVTENDRFFSYRRDGTTGRMASLIWILPK